MRYSPFERREFGNPCTQNASNLEFLEATIGKVAKEHRPGAILLVGANDPRSLALRQSQAAIRFDRRASDWSHAALIIDFDHTDVARSVGVEVSLDPYVPREQVPERNGVTRFELGRYLDGSLFCNLGLFFPRFDRDPERRRTLLATAINPNQDRQRYPFWDLLARWAQYSYSAQSSANPLLDNVPLPSAALCEYAYEAAGIDLTPGATGNYCCPEVLHSTMRYWQPGLESQEDTSFDCYQLVRDSLGAPGKKASPTLDEIDLGRPARGKAARSAGKTTERSAAKKTARRSGKNPTKRRGS